METRAMLMVMTTMWAMATATRLVGYKKGKSKSGKGNSVSNEGGG